MCTYVHLVSSINGLRGLVGVRGYCSIWPCISRSGLCLELIHVFFVQIVLKVLQKFMHACEKEI